MRPYIHSVLHIIVPFVVAYFGYKKYWVRAWLIMLSTLFIDFDHLLADPIFDPNRCSIGFHPLHSYVAISVYAGITFIPKFRLIGIGLLIHIALDLIDCLWMKWLC